MDGLLILQVVLLSVLVPGGVYVWMEVAFDGTSHWLMGVAGVLAFNICRWLVFLPYPLFAFLSSVVILIIELGFGLWINKDYSVWDYRNKRFNYKGQICLTFYLIWLVVMPPLIKGLHLIMPSLH